MGDSSEPNAVEGIYPRREFSHEKLTAESIGPFIKQLCADFDKQFYGDGDANENLIAVENYLREVISSYVDGPFDQSTAMQMLEETIDRQMFSKSPAESWSVSLDGKQFYRRKREFTEKIHDTEAAIEIVGALKHLFSHQPQDSGRIYLAAIQLGRYLERIEVREFEPLVAIGKRARQRAAKGGAASVKWTDEIDSYARTFYRSDRRHSHKATCIYLRSILYEKFEILFSTSLLEKRLRDEQNQRKR